MLVVGITGLAGTGKSTVADHLIERHGFERGKFAGALKEMLRTLLRYRAVGDATIERMIEGDLKEVASAHLNGRTPRHAMITLGTEWGRDHIDVDLWVNAEIAAIGRRKPAALVFDDVRYPNEVDAIYRLGGQIWRVGRTIDDMNPAIGAHVSESLDVVPDRRLLNCSTKAELHMHVDLNVSALKRKLAARAA